MNKFGLSKSSKATLSLILAVTFSSAIDTLLPLFSKNKNSIFFELSFFFLINIVSFIFVGVGSYIFLFKGKLSDFIYKEREKIGIKNFVLVIMLIFFVLKISGGINSIFNNIINFLDVSNILSETDKVSLTTSRLLIYLLNGCILAPISEELLFRGILFESYDHDFSRKKAIILSALLFSLMHANMQQLIYAFVAGILFNLIYCYTKSIFICIIVHGGNNFIFIMLNYISIKKGINIVNLPLFRIISTILPIGLIIYYLFNEKRFYKLKNIQKTRQDYENYYDLIKVNTQENILIKINIVILLLSLMYRSLY